MRGYTKSTASQTPWGRCREPEARAVTTFAGISGATLVIGLVLARRLRGITAECPGSDAHRQLAAAAQAGRWRWPSDMHRYAQGKARMKDAAILLLVAAQRLLRDRTTFYPVAALCVAAHGLSALLVFIVAATYWSPAVGLLCWALYLTSIWPYKLVLLGGYQLVAQVACLAAVACLQQASASAWPVPAAAWDLGAGLAAGVMLFSSASARKFVPLLLGAFAVRHAAPWAPLWSAGGHPLAAARLLLLWIGPAAVALGVGWLLARGLYPRIVTAVYHGRGSRLLSGLMVRRERPPLAHYLAMRDQVLRGLGRLGVAVLLAGAACGVFWRTPLFYRSLGLVGLGVVIVVGLLTAPNMLENLRGYWLYWNLPVTSAHFRLYQQHFAQQGRPLPPGMRGAGVPWLIRFAWRLLPWHTGFAVAALGGLVAVGVHRGGGPAEMAAALGVLALGLSPVLVGEVTKGFQLSRSYFPGFLGLLLIVGYGLSRITAGVSPATAFGVWGLAAPLVVASTVWNAWQLVTDLWPTRMASRRLVEALAARGITRFATYATAYNHALVDVLQCEYPGRFAVRTVETLREAASGYVVVPGTSAKALNMESEGESIEQGDFGRDPWLNELLESRAITRYAVASLPTVGSSRFWSLEGEVTGYRDLIMREVREADRWRARAWIVDAGRWHADGRRPSPAAPPLVAEAVAP